MRRLAAHVEMRKVGGYIYIYIYPGKDFWGSGAVPLTGNFGVRLCHLLGHCHGVSDTGNGPFRGALFGVSSSVLACFWGLAGPLRRVFWRSRSIHARFL